MAKQDPSKLRDKAVAASAKGKYKKAIEFYLELEKLEAKDGSWPRKVGEMYRQLGDDRAAIDAFGRASKVYARQGFLVKAVATCKIILRIDPDHVLAQEQLVAFNAERGLSIKSADAPFYEPGSAVVQEIILPVPTPLPFPAPESVASEGDEEALDLELDAPLESLALRERVKGATERKIDSLPSGIFEIPLELDIPMDFPSTEETIGEALAQTPLFSALSPASLHRLIEKVEFLELPAGQALFHQGDAGSSLFVIAEGRVSIEVDQAPVGELGEGAFFGEVSLVTDQPRSATVKAKDNVELLCIERQAIGGLIREEPAVLTVLLRFLRERLVDNLSKTSPLFEPFSGAERNDLIARFRFLEVDAGSVLVKEGEISPALYVTMSGAFAVDRAASGQVQRLATLSAGDLFGEMSLLANGGAVASVVALSKCLVLELPAQPFRELIMANPHVLAFVGDLASEREKALAAVAGGEQEYEELSLDLF